MMAAEILAASVAALLMVVQLVSVGLGTLRLRFAPGPRNIESPSVTLLIPVRGVDPFAQETLGSAFLQDYANYEIVFTVASANDPAVPLIETLIARHPQRRARLLVGDERPTGNPKLNNLSKGWDASKSEWVAMVDSNALMRPGYLRALVDAADDETGLVTSPAIGMRGEGVWASTEAAFLNTFQARWQFLADLFGFGFAQGKTLFWRRAVLDAGGGLVVLGSDLAEDVAATKLVRRSGLKVRLVDMPVEQPIGRRLLADVWSRQLRWTRIRRLGFFWLFLPEILMGAMIPTIMVACLVAAGIVPFVTLPAYLGIWYGVEWAMARQNRWPAGPADMLAMLIRDAMLPFLYLWSFASDHIQWRGTVMEAPHVASPVAMTPSQNVRPVSH